MEQNFSKKPKHIHFIGICGVAMSALAIAFKKFGYTVTGSDVGFFPPVSTNLKDAHANFYPGWHPELMTKNGNPDIVVVGNVASSTNPEWLFAKANNLVCKSYPEIIRDYFLKDTSIVCAGTYAKSTTSTLLAWILKESGLNPSYMFGGVALNKIDPAEITTGNISVVEGDEYTASRWDTGPKFAYYKPTHLLLTSIVWDHADVYPTEASYKDAFQKLVDDLPPNGTLVISEKALPILTFHFPLSTFHFITYGKEAGNTYAYGKIKLSQNGITFEIRHGKNTYQIASQTLGDYMADNITGCVAIAHSLGIEPQKIIAAIKSFIGVRRRLEKRFSGNITVFDDIAHSPKKVQAILSTLHAVYSGKIFAVFEPNSGNREPHSAPGYAQAFRDADTVIVPRLTKLKIADGKPAPMEGVDLAKIIAETHDNVEHIDNDANVISFIKEKTRPGDVVVFLGSHGFRGMIEDLIISLRQQP